MQFRRIDHTQIRPPIQRLRSNQIFAQISHCYWGVGGSSLKPRRHSWGKCIFLNRAGVYWIYKRPSLGFALGPRGANCLRARIFQYIPPLGSVLLHFLTSVYVDPRTKNQHNNELWISKKIFCVFVRHPRGHHLWLFAFANWRNELYSKDRQIC